MQSGSPKGRWIGLTLCVCAILVVGCGSGDDVTVIQGGIPSGATSVMFASPDTGVVANGATASTITVTVRSSSNIPVAGQVVQFSATGSGNLLTQPSITTDANGVATGSIASTTVETKTITAMINPGPSQVIVNQAASVTFASGPGPVSNQLSTVSVSPTSGIVADGTQLTTITVTVLDAIGNPVPGQTVQLFVTGSGNTLTQPSSPTDANGIATGSLASTNAESKTMFAVVNPGAGQVLLADAPTAQFIGDANGISEINSTVAAVPGQDVVADGVEVSTVTATVLDVNGNPVPGQIVQLSSTGSNNTVSQPPSTTDANGVATGSIASTTAELKTFTVTVNPGANQVVPSQQPTVSFVGDPANIGPANSTAVAGPQVLQANGTSTSTIVVTVLDLNGNPVEGQTVQLASTGSNNTITQPFGLTDASGVASGTIASTTAETKTITCTVNPGVGQVVLVQTPTTRFVGDLIAEDDVRLCYGEGLFDQARIQTWDDSSVSWSSVTATPSANTTIRWAVDKFAPPGSFEHLLGVLSDTGVGTDLDLLRWDGDNWTVEWSSTAIVQANADKRGFDLEYESSSGDALVVYANNTVNPVFRTLSGGTWSAETNVFATPPGAGDVLWVELVGRSGTDEIALVYADAASRLHAVIWDGSAWNEAGTEITLSTTMSTVTQSQAFDVTYETQSGDLLVVWGHQFTLEQIQYATKPADLDFWVTATLTTAQARAKVVRLAPDPGSDRIAAVLTEGNGDRDTVAMIWDGVTWAVIRQVDNNCSNTDRDAAIGWVGNSGTLALVYSDNDGGAEIDWAKWTPFLGWVLQPDVLVTGMGNLQAVGIRPCRNQGKLMLVLSDSNSNLYAATYDGFNWVVTNGGAPLNSNLSSLNTEPFSFTVK